MLLFYVKRGDGLVFLDIRKIFPEFTMSYWENMRLTTNKYEVFPDMNFKTETKLTPAQRHEKYE